jgi:hypothetical protein
MRCAVFFDGFFRFRPNGQRRYLNVNWEAPQTPIALKSRAFSR